MAAISSRRRGGGADYTWPGYVDALTTLLMVLLFLLPLITCLLATTAVWRDIREGRLQRLTTIGTAEAIPDTRLRRGLMFGLVATIVAAPPILIVLALAIRTGRL